MWGQDILNRWTIYLSVTLSKLSTIAFCILIGSGWLVDRLMHLDITVAKYDPHPQKKHRPLPRWIVEKRSYWDDHDDEQTLMCYF